MVDDGGGHERIANRDRMFVATMGAADTKPDGTQMYEGMLVGIDSGADRAGVDRAVKRQRTEPRLIQLLRELACCQRRRAFFSFA